MQNKWRQSNWVWTWQCCLYAWLWFQEKLPLHHELCKRFFLFPDILPGGERCAMNPVSCSGVLISKYAVLIWFFRSMSQLDQTWDLTCTSHHPARSLHSTKMVRFSCRNLLTKSMKSNFFHRMWHSWFWASLRQWLQLKLCSFADYQTKMISMWFFQMIFVRCHVLSRRWVIRLTISHIHFLLNRFD